MSFLTLLYMFILVQFHDGGITKNPGPRKLKKSLAVCNWNLHGIPAHNSPKFTQLEAYISIYKYNFKCLSETYQDSSVPDSLLEIDVYNLFMQIIPKNTKRCEVCIFYNESLFC